MQPLDDVGCPRALPLILRQSREAEQAVARFLQTVDDGAMRDAPFADDGLAPLSNHFRDSTRGRR